VALSRVVIAQRERTVVIRPMEGGLVAHTLYEQRDINDAKWVFEDTTAMKTDPEMVALARQLIDRQTTTYDPSDIEDRYETRLRAMIDAKLKGEGIEDEEPVEPDRGNVVDLMAALRKSVGQEGDKPTEGLSAPKAKARAKVESAAKPTKKAAAGKTVRRAPKPTRKRA
jgi:DNA end-binding protein Ku